MALLAAFDPSFSGLRKTLPSKFTLKVRGNFFDTPRLKRLLSDANREALSRCGVRIQMAAKRGIGQRAPARTKAWQMRTRGHAYEQINGGLYRNITPYNSGKPRPGGSPVKSWMPNRFLYRSLMFYWQQSSRSVIIGPDKAPWLARLHEFGGAMRMQAYAIGVDQARIARRRRDRGRPIPTFANGMPRTGVLLWSSRGIRTGGLWTRLGVSRTARYPARPYMGSRSVQTALGKLPKEFQDTISGPGSGRP